VLAVAFALVATSLEAARTAGLLLQDQTANRGALSIWWGIFGIALLATGALKKNSPARYAGLALLTVATLKAVLWDLAAVGDAVRVASFVVLGLLLLGVSAGYLRSKSAEANNNRNNKTPQ
jgi:uncharacterized membrane protein